MIQNHRIHLSIPFMKKDLGKSIPGARWDASIREWSWPISQYKLVCDCFPVNRAQLAKEFEIYCNEHDVIKPTPQPDPVEHNILEESKRMQDPPPSMFKLKPYRHQIDMFKAGSVYKKLAYFCEMGTGKTKVIIDLIKYRDLRTIVFSPKSVIENWGKEVDKNSDLPYTICTGTRREKEKALLDDGAKVVVTNYETILTFGATAEVWSGFKMVVLDESSKIKSHKAKRTKAILTAFKNTPYKYILSGTPITQSPCDIYTQMYFLEPSILGNGSFYAFRNTYCEMGGYQNYQIVRHKNMDVLRSKISSAAVELKKDTCLDLPPKTYDIRHLDMDTELRAQYNEMKNEAVLELESGENITAPIILTKIMRLQQILSGQYMTKGRNEKLEELTEIITNAIGYGRQVVVWARFRKSIDIICARLSSLGIAHSILHGDVTNRQSQIDTFQEGKTKVFVGQESTGGMGITLHAANVMVYFENDFSLENRKQSEDRIHRIGQNKKCLYIDLVYKGTIDEQVLTAINSKEKTAMYLVRSFGETTRKND